MLTITTDILIRRPLAVVREQFFDLDHAMRTNLLDGVRMSWITPSVPGERRIMQEVRVLGIPQTDEIVVEEGSDGALIKRFEAGTNKGTVFHETFEPVEGDSTRVTITATVPATGFKWAIGPIFKLAVRKALDKALQAHKRDIEGGYEPGRARGNVEAVLGGLERVRARATSLTRDAERIALVAPLLETACVTAVADDDIDDAERDAIRTLVRSLGVAMIDDDALEALVASSVDQTRAKGIENRCDELGARLKKLELVDEGLRVATLVASISHGVDQAELAILQRLAQAAGFDSELLVEMIESVERALASEVVAPA